MRKIVDRSFLQAPELREYLAASRKNSAVLTDYVLMEAFKGETVQNITSATEILCEFPKQVIVLKPTGIICQLKGRRCGFTRRMISKDETKGFSEWCKGLTRAKAGDKDLERQLLEKGKDADAQLGRMLEAQSSYAANLDEHAKRYTDAELKALRRREPMSDGMFDRVFDNILGRAAILIAGNPNIRELPPSPELPYTFIFRYSLTGYLLDLCRLADGGAKGVSPKN
jgi:hypothetical protein